MIQQKQQSASPMDYQQLIIKHLDRISFLSGAIMGEQVLHFGHSTGSELRTTENDKQEAFIWTTRVLDALIPEDFKDDEYSIRKEKARKDNTRKVKTREGEEEMVDFSVHYEHLHNAINLLNRKGFLIQTRGIGRYFGKKNQDKGAQEEWE